MNAPHYIRLAGPWERTVLSSGEANFANSDATVRMPIDLAADLGDQFSGRVEYRRFFNRPTRIDESTKLVLAFEHVAGRKLEVFLNDELLGQHEHASGRLPFDVRDQLKLRNLLRVRLSTLDHEILGADAKRELCGLVGEVRLEIG